jgi:N-acetylglucosaminyldiphosphoundecaprenol N-acetyl-beta-D-mannosaminyltransferase
MEKKTKKYKNYRINYFSAKILKTKVDFISLNQALNLIKKWLNTNKQYQITTPNPEHIVLATKDYRFRKIINTSALAIADGVGLIWAVKYLKFNQSQNLYRLSGTDLMLALADEACKNNLKIFLLGGKRNTAKKTAQALDYLCSNKQPGFKNSAAATNIAYDSGVFDISQETEDEKQRIISKINQFKPDVLLVAYGAPWQEFWINKNLQKLEVKVAMGVGGAFDFLSGTVKRAPGWLRQLGLEWLYRLVRQPWRWKRQLTLIKFMFLIFKHKKS